MREHVFAGLLLGGAFGVFIALGLTAAGVVAGPELVMRGVTVHAYEAAALYLAGGLVGGALWGCLYRPNRGAIGHSLLGVATVTPFCLGLPLVMRRSIPVAHGVATALIVAVVLGGIVGPIFASILGDDE